MKLIDILKDCDYEVIRGDLNRPISNLTFNSEQMHGGDLFIALKGAHHDGHEYIKEAIRFGAFAVIGENFEDDLSVYTDSKDTVFIKCRDSHKILGKISANFYGHPADKLTIIGITGTKGKTTVTNMIKQILDDSGNPCCSIGSLGIDYGSNHINTKNTTPDSITIQKTMSEIVKQGYKYLVMEASSQAFKLNRLNGINFDIGVFLNIDNDHIGENEHKDFEEYLNCKKEIFNNSKEVIVNKDDQIWSLLNENQRNSSITFSIDQKADYTLENIQPYKKKHEFGSKFNFKNLHYTLPIPGDFNTENALAALAVIDQLGISLDKAQSSLDHYITNGRTQLIKEAIDYDRTVFIDYAHNFISYKRFLEMLRSYKPGKLICIFSVIWDEVKMRRHDKGLAAGTYSDLAILTTRNSGPEGFKKISQDVEKGLKKSKGDYMLIEDRKKAIQYALDIAGPDDIVALIGMGDKRDIYIDGQKQIFDEKKVVIDYLKEKFSKDKSEVL